MTSSSTARRSLLEFLRTEQGGAGLLLAATVVALLWANVPGGAERYDELWHTGLGIGWLSIDLDLGHWVNDGLMAVFFYVVGLEIRRELALGALRDRRAAAIPAVAALAGMVAPALLYALINGGGEGARGWGIVMATDIAFVLGALALVGDRVPSGVRVFLLTLAIVDDIGAIAVIAAFYGDGIDGAWLAGAAAALVAAAVLVRRIGDGAWRGAVYVGAGLVLWYATYRSGIHPTIAAVALGLITVVHEPVSDGEGGERLSPNERFMHRLHPWSAFLVIPIFALANAGVPLSGDALSDAVSSPVAIGVVVGLVVGKALGISLATLGAVRLGVGPLPGGMQRGHVPGAAALAGIGFTVSLFVADLAFTSETLRDQAKIGVLVASVLAAVLGLAALRSARTNAPEARTVSRRDA